MNRNVKRAECSAKNFFRGCMLLILKKITFFTVKDQLNTFVLYPEPLFQIRKLHHPTRIIFFLTLYYLYI